jgi:hypothetical protein
VRTSVLYSLTSSLNASLISTAQGIARKLKNSGIPVLEASVEDIAVVMTGPDLNNTLDQSKSLATLAQLWRDDLYGLTKNSNAGSISGTIDFFINNPRSLDEELLKTVLEMAEMKDMPTAVIKAKHDAEQKRRSRELEGQKGEIEWIIDQALAYANFDDDNRDELFFALSEDVQSRITEKTASALTRTRDSAIMAIVTGDKRQWSFGDLPVINNLIKQISM